MPKLKNILSMYHPKTPYVLVYMLQQVEYSAAKLGDWINRFPDYVSVMHRQTLTLTNKASLLLSMSYATWFLHLGLSVWLLLSSSAVLALILFILLPLTPMGVLIVSVAAGSVYNYNSNKKLIANSGEIFQNAKAVKIAVVGSYGKTTIKELLLTVLSEGKKTVATPGNMNVAISHAKFARKLKGDEEVLIVEFGEGKPGDVAKMSKTVKPDYAVITGLAPNHLDYYSSLKELASDLLSVRRFVSVNKLFITEDSDPLHKYLKSDDMTFGQNEVMGWKVKKAEVSITGIKFEMHKGKKKLKLSSALLGRHQIGPIAFVAAISDKLGLTSSQIEQGVSNTAPFKHRMQPRNINGAWIIDDTYNGNIEGLKAGLNLMRELNFKKKIYVTPGLVDQGTETVSVHEDLGRAIAEANPDVVVLMKSTVSDAIERSMRQNGFSGELRVETDPLYFYTNIEHTIAAGDLVLMQNDWTDNYN